MSLACFLMSIISFLIGWFLHKKYNPQSSESISDEKVVKAMTTIGEVTRVVERVVSQQTVKFLCGSDDAAFQRLNKAICTMNLQQSSVKGLLPVYTSPLSISLHTVSGGTSSSSGSPRDIVKEIPVAKFHLKNLWAHVGLASFEDLDHMRIPNVKYTFSTHAGLNPIISVTRTSGSLTAVLFKHLKFETLNPGDSLNLSGVEYMVISVSETDVEIDLKDCPVLDAVLDFAVKYWEHTLAMKSPAQTFIVPTVSAADEQE